MRNDHRNARLIRPASSARWSRCVLVSATLLTIQTAGCTSMSKGPVADNLITSRELSLSGMQAIGRDQWEQAEMLFSRAIEACPTDERARSRYAETLWRRGATSQAIAHLEEAVRLSGGDPGLHVRLGEMYLGSGNLDRAEVNAERAIDRNGQLASAWALRGDVMYQRERLDEALASYHRVLNNQPHYPHVQLAAAGIYQRTGRHQRALTTLEALADQYPPGHEPQQVMYLHGLALKGMGRYQEAAESLVAATGRGAPSVDMLYELGETHMLAGDRTSARKSVMAALDVDPLHQASQHLKSHLEGGPQQLTVSLPP